MTKQMFSLFSYSSSSPGRLVRTHGMKVGTGGGGGGSDDRKWDNRDRCPVFQLVPVKNAVIQLEDVRDIYEICQQVRHRANRESIYIVNNLHMEGVETYLHTVQYFERCLKKAAYPKKKSNKRA
jgi:hypothetical protein